MQLAVRKSLREHIGGSATAIFLLLTKTIRIIKTTTITITEITITIKMPANF